VLNNVGNLRESGADDRYFGPTCGATPIRQNRSDRRRQT